LEVLPGVFAIDFRGRVWAYLVGDGDGFTLVDSGIAGDVDTVREAVREAGGELSDIKQIILTHYHADHAGTAGPLQRVTGATTLAHAADADVIRGKAEAAAAVLSAQEKVLFDELAADMPPAPPAEVHHDLSDGDEIEIGGEAARVIHVPGHTPGSIAIHLPWRGLLFTGDAAASLGTRLIVGVFNADPDEARRSFVKLAALAPDAACFGHGPAITNGAAQAFRALAERL
jgi:glyoxylase-like metal-dependent hydrolase (beta-lactamase superfamily II)